MAPPPGALRTRSNHPPSARRHLPTTAPGGARAGAVEVFLHEQKIIPSLPSSSKSPATLPTLLPRPPAGLPPPFRRRRQPRRRRWRACRRPVGAGLPPPPGDLPELRAKLFLAFSLPFLKFDSEIGTSLRFSEREARWVILGASSSSPSSATEEAADPGLVMNFYIESCPQAEEIIKEQVMLNYKHHKNTAFSWLRNIFHDCAVESCDASLLLDSTRRELRSSGQVEELKKFDAAIFSPFWNEIMRNLREEDYISNFELDLLLMPKNSGILPLVQWPLFLLASKIFLAKDIALETKDSQDEL